MLARVAAATMLAVGMTSSAWGQSERADAPTSGFAVKALGFFERIEERNFDDYLKRVRLPQVSEFFQGTGAGEPGQRRGRQTVNRNADQARLA